MADQPFAVSRAALYEALGNDRVARAIEKLLQAAMAQLTAQVLVAVASDAYPAGRVLTAGDGIVLDDTVDGVLTASVTPALELDSLHVTDDIEADDDITAHGDIRADGEIRGATLRLDGAPTASIALPNYTLPITLNGTTFYLTLSDTP